MKEQHEIVESMISTHRMAAKALKADRERGAMGLRPLFHMHTVQGHKVSFNQEKHGVPEHPVQILETIIDEMPPDVDVDFAVLVADGYGVDWKEGEDEPVIRHETLEDDFRFNPLSPVTEQLLTMVLDGQRKKLHSLTQPYRIDDGGKVVFEDEKVFEDAPFEGRVGELMARLGKVEGF